MHLHPPQRSVLSDEKRAASPLAGTGGSAAASASASSILVLPSATSLLPSALTNLLRVASPIPAQTAGATSTGAAATANTALPPESVAYFGPNTSVRLNGLAPRGLFSFRVRAQS